MNEIASVTHHYWHPVAICAIVFGIFNIIMSSFIYTYVYTYAREEVNKPFKIIIGVLFVSGVVIILGLLIVLTFFPSIAIQDVY